MADLPANSAECIDNFLTDSGIIEMRCSTAGNYVIVSDRKHYPVVPEKLPDQSFYPVSNNSITNFFADRYTEPCPGKY
ncbi:MAG: hypothetical protein WC568_10195 [Candidatus Methanoperedens sp.]